MTHPTEGSDVYWYKKGRADMAEKLLKQISKIHNESEGGQEWFDALRMFKSMIENTLIHELEGKE